MSENPIKDAAIEVLKERSKEIYDDGLKPVTKEGGEILQTIVGLFNNVVLYPVKKANLTFRYKLEQFEKDLKLKTDNIPDDKLIEPPLNIAGPTIEALKYTFDTKEIREMYINLLSSSMNADTVRLAHPSYVEIIKSMTPLDAIVFKNAAKDSKNIPCARVTIGFDDKSYTYAMPTIFAPDLIGEEDPFLVSSSIENLCRLGILTHLETSIVGYDYDLFKQHPFVMKQFEKFKNVNPRLKLKIDIVKQVIFASDFGKNFAKACLQY
ncbi:hypothetical protein CLRAG_29440 [Clostridium ragsdalei P11]|uniref:DUF4393 domain-containing protein n=1 Tax=Clostridium ragsdalei P11 TaxID=1353534 RepID=A0A1A6ANE4_9CLOT|nr:DUF4393 domain-containing protein [Clostridium ragsdalei]OBR91580.1 hypothetical protein CLRAG_29440 [Clostridium ragsdalei P11]